MKHTLQARRDEITATKRRCEAYLRQVNEDMKRHPARDDVYNQMLKERNGLINQIGNVEAEQRVIRAQLREIYEQEGNILSDLLDLRDQYRRSLFGRRFARRLDSLIEKHRR